MCGGGDDDDDDDDGVAVFSLSRSSLMFLLQNLALEKPKKKVGKVWGHNRTLSHGMVRPAHSPSLPLPFILSVCLSVCLSDSHYLFPFNIYSPLSLSVSLSLPLSLIILVLSPLSSFTTSLPPSRYITAF